MPPTPHGYVDRRTFLQHAGAAGIAAVLAPATTATGTTPPAPTTRSSPAAAPAARPPTRPPNLVLITWHDAGNWFGCEGHAHVRTPHVDRLAAEGVRFANCFSACAICSPSRATIMTGRHPQATGVMSLTNSPFDNRIAPHLPHLGARLRAAGHHVALLGVQHECAHEHVSATIQPHEVLATDPWPGGHLLAGHVRNWLHARRSDRQPFFLQVGTHEAHLGRFFSGATARPDEPYPPVRDHRPDLPLPPDLSGSPEDHATVATLHGLLSRGDQVVGAVLDGLASAGLADNTLVVLCVDHGVGLARAKAQVYDAGTRVSWMLRHPGLLPAGASIPALCGHIDVLPTLLDLLGIRHDDPLDGRSLAQLARSQSAAPADDAVFSFMVEAARSIRTPRWRLIRNFTPGRPPAEKGNCARLWRKPLSPPPPTPPPDTLAPSADRPLVELYDAAADPHNLRNLASDPSLAATRDGLDERLFTFLASQDDFVLHRPIRTAWDEATRADLESLAGRTGRPLPPAAGPRGNRVDGDTAAGRISPV